MGCGDGISPPRYKTISRQYLLQQESRILLALVRFTSPHTQTWCEYRESNSEFNLGKVMLYHLTTFALAGLVGICTLHSRYRVRFDEHTNDYRSCVYLFQPQSHKSPFVLLRWDNTDKDLGLFCHAHRPDAFSNRLVIDVDFRPFNGYPPVVAWASNCHFDCFNLSAPLPEFSYLASRPFLGLQRDRLPKTHTCLA